MKKDATAFSLIGAAMTAVLFIVANIITTPGVLWFFYPVFAVAWWPLSVYFCGKRQYFAFAAVGSALIIAFLAATNIVTSPQLLWFFYAIPPILCWPAGVFLHQRKKGGLFAIVAGTAMVAYCVLLDLVLTPYFFWAIFPIFLILWWPLSVLSRGNAKVLSVGGALLTIAFLVVTNLLYTVYPWALFAGFPILLWPAAVFAVPKMGHFRFSVLGALITFIYYGALNMLFGPASPWSMTVAFAVAWWPLSVFYYGRGKAFRYSVIMTIISIAFFTAVNLIYSPDAIWAFYPAYALLWWPISVFYYGKRKPVHYAAVMTALSAAFFAAINILYSPGTPWAFYPVYALLWWPVSIFFRGRREPHLYAAVMTALSIALFAGINLLYSPGTPWAFYPAYAVLWWPVTLFFARKRAWFAYSIAESLLSIAFLLAVNLITSPALLWSAFPGLAILWWPLSAYFKGKHNPLGYAVGGTVLACALFVSVNLLTSPDFPWFVFPVFAVLWWPLSALYFHVRRRRVAG